MGYPDYPYPTEIEDSFITSQQVLEFLRSYADHFNLRPHIKLQHEVIRVRPRLNDWEVSADAINHCVTFIHIILLYERSIDLI